MSWPCNASTISRYDEEEEAAGQLKRAGGFTIQRMEDDYDEEEYGQMKMANDASIQRMSPEAYEEDEIDYPLQGKFNGNSFTLQKKDGPDSGPLPGELQAKMESTMGADFSDVNVHTDSSAATDVGALAFAQGKDVHFAPGQFKPETTSGQELIGHEFAHVQQQAQGRVQPTTEVAGMPVNDNVGLEAEADALGKAAAQAKVDPTRTKK